MSRRRLRIISSSDEEDEEPPPPSPPPQQQHEDDIDDDVILDDIEVDFQTVTLNSSNPTPNTNSFTTKRNSSRTTVEPIPLDISDDDIEEDIIIDNNDATANNSNNGSTNYSTHSYFGGSDSPMNGVLEMLGLKLKKEWLDSCLSGLQATLPGFQGMDDPAKAKLCFQQFLLSDMNYSGAGVLPPNVHRLHMVDLKGPFVLQVDEVVNISCPLRGRYQNAVPGIKRCLKLSMTDGVQRVFGMEYRPIKDIESLAPAGLKIAICNVNIRRGILMLVPEVLEVLGGSVEELDAARQRLIAEINKPPRGKRNRTGIVTCLAARATLAAWPPLNVTVPEDVDRIPNPAPVQANVQHQETALVNDRQRQTSSLRGGGNNASSVPRPHEHVEVPTHFDRPAFVGGGDNASTVPRPREHVEVPMHFDRPAFRGGADNASSVPWPHEHVEVPTRRPEFRGGGENASSVRSHEHAEVIDRSASTPSQAAGQGTASDIFANDRHRQVSAVSASGNDAEPFVFSARKPQDCAGQGTVVGSSSKERPREDFVFSAQKRQECASISPQNINIRTPARATGQKTLPGMLANFVENVTVPAGRDSTEPNSLCAVDMDIEEISMVNGLDRAFLLARYKETPFTYLASLSANLAVIEDHASVIRGKIKCFVTGVIQFKRKPTYELQVYVDDGSLISEILIHHNVVQNIIGHSPQEVASALAASDPVMQDTLLRFQKFLINFEGTMVVEMKKTSQFPVATEMNQGCPANDSLLLLTRLKSYTTSQTQNHSRSNPS